MNADFAALREILYLALAEPIGLLLDSDDGPRLRQRLYAARLKCGDPALSKLQFRIWPGSEGSLAITRGVEPSSKSQPKGTVAALEELR